MNLRDQFLGDTPLEDGDKGFVRFEPTAAGLLCTVRSPGAKVASAFEVPYTTAIPLLWHTLRSMLTKHPIAGGCTKPPQTN